MTLFDVICQQAITGLANGLIISLVALGYTMVYGIIELVNFAHGDLVMLGCFAALTVIGVCGLAPPTDGSLPLGSLALLLLLVPPFTAGLAWLIDRVAYRPLRQAPKLTALASTIGVSFILINLGLFWGGLPMDVFGGGRGASSPKDVPDLIGYRNLLGEDSAVQITAKDLLVVAVTVPLMLALTWFVQRTRLGTAMRACAQNPQAAALMGINVDRVVALTFVLGGGLAGVAAVVFALYNNAIAFQMGYRIGIDAFTAAVLGGIGSLPGAVLGGVVIGLVRAFSDQFVASAWTNAIVFAVLILVLVFRPGGMLGASRVEKV
jgi:branched-chain amino acid transport system permease protein